jgi:hypothetical protein
MFRNFYADISCLVVSPMDIDSRHPSSSLSPASSIVQSAVAPQDSQDEDLSDTDLSQFQAEIEQNLSSASPESSPLNGTTEPVSDDVMQVDSEEDTKPVNSNKGRRRVNAKEYYDPELFGLRRSVSHSQVSFQGDCTETDLV